MDRPLLLNFGNYGTGSFSNHFYYVHPDTARWQPEEAPFSKVRLDLGKDFDPEKPFIDLKRTRGKIRELVGRVKQILASDPRFSGMEIESENVGTHIFRDLQGTERGREYYIPRIQSQFDKAADEYGLSRQLFQFKVISAEEEATLAGEGAAHCFLVGDEPVIVDDCGSGSGNMAVLRNNAILLAASTPIGPHSLRAPPEGIRPLINERLTGFREIRELAGTGAHLITGGGRSRYICRVYQAEKQYLRRRVHGTTITPYEMPEFRDFLDRFSGMNELQAAAYVGALEFKDDLRAKIVERLPILPKAALVLASEIDYLRVGSVTFTRSGLPDGMLRRRLAKELPPEILNQSQLVYVSQRAPSYNLSDEKVAPETAGALRQFIEPVMQDSGLREEVITALCYLSGARNSAAPKAFERVTNAKMGDLTDHETYQLATALHILNGGDYREVPEFARRTLNDDERRAAVVGGSALRVAFQVGASNINNINNFARLNVDDHSHHIDLKLITGKVRKSRKDEADETTRNISRAYFRPTSEITEVSAEAFALGG